MGFLIHILLAQFTKRQCIPADGFEPSGQIHIAQGLLRAISINKLTEAGCTFYLLVADWHALANNKMGGDLGLKDLATLSDGTKLENPKWFRDLEDKLAIAQRARNKRRVKAIHAKIRRRRKHHLHVATARIAKQYRTIFVGDVNSSQLAKTNMAKSVMDASWYAFKQQLAYKARRHRGAVVVVDEAYSTQTCSSCGAIPASSPKGRAGLGMRTWECSCCGAVHDRDVNAAVNVLKFGLERQPPAEESPRL